MLFSHLLASSHENCTDEISKDKAYAEEIQSKLHTIKYDALFQPPVATAERDVKTVNPDTCMYLGNVKMTLFVNYTSEEFSTRKGAASYILAKLEAAGLPKYSRKHLPSIGDNENSLEYWVDPWQEYYFKFRSEGNQSTHMDVTGELVEPGYLKGLYEHSSKEELEKY